ncbi:hypothetical protein ACQJBY_068553 [Aegilops geniculata]
MASSVRSGKHRRDRGGDGDLRRPGLKKTTGRALGGVRWHVGRRGGIGDGGGSLEHGGDARQWQRPRRTVSAATSSAQSRERERAERGVRSRERRVKREGELGVSVARFEGRGGCHDEAGGGIVGRACAGTQLLVLLAGGRRWCCPCGLGQNRSWARQAGQVSGPGSFLSLCFIFFCFIFLLLCHCFQI